MTTDIHRLAAAARRSPAPACPPGDRPVRAPARAALLAVGACLVLAGCKATMPGTGAAADAPGATAGAAPAPAPSCEKLPMSNAKRTAVATAVGATLGLVASAASGGHKARHHATGALGGALVGALAASAFRNEIDVEEQPDGSVRLKIPGSLMFASGQHALSAGFQSTLTSVSTTIRRYCDLSIRVVGHTDDVGSAASNQSLSERRAASVSGWMQQQGLPAARFVTEGRGETQPIASNADEAGRAANRRVEIFVRPPAS